MATKNLKIKRVFAWVIYDNLRKTAPKDYPTTAEIKSTLSDVLPAIKPLVENYSAVMVRAAELGDKVNAKEVSEEESKVLVEEINKEWKAYNKKEGIEIVEIALSEEGLKTLKAQFERDGWGRRWIATIEEFAELSAAFDEATK